MMVVCITGSQAQELRREMQLKGAWLPAAIESIVSLRHFLLAWSRSRVAGNRSALFRSQHTYDAVRVFASDLLE